MSLVMTHTRFQFLETIRVPIAVIGTMMFPALALLFFVVPQEAVAGDPVAATAAAGQLSLFSVVSVCLFQFGAGVAEDRSSAWDPYVRTLPAGVTPRMAGRVLNGVLFALLGMLPVLLVAALLTAASVTPGQLVLGALALVVAALPFFGMGLAIGYSLTVKGAVPVAQVVLFPMAFAGGLFLPPENFPRGLDLISQLLPTRAGRDLVVPLLLGEPVLLRAVVVLAFWTLGAGSLAVWAYRRDEGRRFR